jgi:hypothetical protein
MATKEVHRYKASAIIAVFLTFLFAILPGSAAVLIRSDERAADYDFVSVWNPFLIHTSV